MTMKNIISKRILSLLMALALVISMIPVSAIPAHAAEATTITPELKNGYYELETADDLYWFAEYVNSGNYSANAKLMNDIVLNENVVNADGELQSGSFKQWTPIGKNSDSAYTGTFDGQGHTISGLYIGGSDTVLGLFGINGGTIKNVGLINSYIQGSQNIGSIVYYNWSGGTVSYCWSDATLKATASSSYIGGIAQSSAGTIEYCYYIGKIIGSGDTGFPQAIGGLVNNLGVKAVTKNCYSRASISSRTDKTTWEGALFYDARGTVSDCYYDTSKTLYPDIYQKSENPTIKNVSGKTATEFTNGTVCSNVGFHSYVWSYDANYHTQKCNLCGAVNVSSNAHTFDSDCDPNCNGGCGYYRTTTIAHSGGTANCQQDAVCSECGRVYAYKDTSVHASSEFTYTDNGDGTHKKIYKCCGAEVETVSHDYQAATCTVPETCKYCGATEGSALGHSYQYTASENVITETCQNNCGYSETATLSLDVSVSLNYTGSEIKPLKVTYSDDWQGGTLSISYSNNTNVSNTASGSITKSGATATQTFAISNATMSGISVSGYSGEYNGKAHSISVTGVPTGADVTYSTNKDGTYITTNPAYTEKGTYEVWYKIEKTNYETISGSANVVISQATNSWTTKPSIAGWTYGEEAEKPIYGAKFGTVKVEYRLASGTDADYTTTEPKDAGSYLVRFSVAGNENYTSLSEVVELEIAKVKLTVTADDKSKTYGESDHTLTWQITSGKMVGTEELADISISREEGNDAKDYTITVSQTDGANPNYEITFVNGTFTIKQKEIDIIWGATLFLPYTGSSLVPEAIVANLEDGDECILTTEVVETTDGAGIVPGTWTAKVTALSNDNYKLPVSGERVSISFEIINAYQDYAPEVSCENETVDGKADGKITGVDNTMEYCKEGDTSYKTISGTEITDLADGTYYVRYAAKTYYNASPAATVVIGVGSKLTVKVPTTQTGYTLTAEDSELVWNGSTIITFTLANGYSPTKDFAVKVNGTKVELTNNQYVITNAQENISVTVRGVADTTAPIAEITLGTNKWNSFFNKITFGLFFKETQSVTVTAEDVNTGSGMDKVYYYLASEELTEDAVKEITAWEEYKGAFNINPNNEYIIYIKAVDNAGNATYISSEYGIILDAVAPVITGVENGGTYYGDTEFGVDESYVDTVTVDGNPVDLTDGKYTITADGKEHTIVAVDKAGNSSATVKITVITIASLDDTIEDIKTTNVKSSDKEYIQKVLDLVNSLLDSGKDFTDTEDKQLSDIKSNAEELIKRIGDATAADDTDNTEKVKDITSDNVTTDDKADLEKAKDDLEKALEDYKDNLTEDEKKAIEDEIDRIDNALDIIEKVEKVEEQISDLPDNITLNDADKITEAQKAYDSLSAYEKTLVDLKVKQELDAAARTMTALKEAANKPKTGDYNNVWMLFALLFISGMSIMGISICEKKKK